MVVLDAAFTLGGLATVSTGDPCQQWPRHSTLEPSASNIALAKVLESKRGIATKASARDVLRGGRFSAGGGYGPAPDETCLACTVGGRHYSPAS